MIKPNRLFFLFVLVFSTKSMAAIAITDSSGTILEGFDDILVGTSLYDVRFVEGSFNTVFGSSVAIDFADPFDAQDASIALKEAFDEFPNWDDHLDGYSPVGFASDTIWEFYTPFSTFGGVVSASIYIDRERADNPFDFTTTGDMTMLVYADWEHVSPIPLPATIWLFGPTLAVFGFISRKHKNQ